MKKPRFRPAVSFATLIATAVLGAAAHAAPSRDPDRSDLAPPELRREATPAPRAGYVWAPGYWDWNGRRHQWVRGEWLRQRPNEIYHSPTWSVRDGRWQIDRGGWLREGQVNWDAAGRPLPPGTPRNGPQGVNGSPDTDRSNMP